MKRYLQLMQIFAVLYVAVCIVGCSGGGPNVEEERPASLAFSHVEVTCERRDGWFWSRHAAFKVSASVQNNTENPVNVDNMPAIEAGDSNKSFEAKITQDKLLPGETCDVTYEGELDVNEEGIPDLSFVGDFDFGGLEDAQVELNAKIQAVEDEYAGEDAAKVQAKEEEAAAREAAEKKKEEDKQALENCVGKTADEALEIARGTEFEYRFVDDFKVDVTDDVNAVSNGAEVHTAKVREVEVGDGGWFSGPNVTFHLDFTDPVAEKERQRKEKEAEAEAAKREAEEAERVKQAEAEAARREQEEAEKAALEAQKKKDQDLLEGCAGKTAEEAYETAEASVLAFRFLDSYDVDVTQSVKDAVAAKKKAAEEQAAKEQATGEQANKGQAAKSEAGEGRASRNGATEEQAAERQAAEGQAAKEQSVEEQTTTEGQTSKEQATEKQAAEKKSVEESNSSKQAESEGTKTNSQVGTDKDKKEAKDSSDEGDKSAKDSKDTSKTSLTESKVLVAKVSKVEVTDGSWFSFDGATIRLDYTDPAAEKERKAQRPTAVFSDVQYDAQLMPPEADRPYSLELTITGKLKVEAAEKGSKDYVDKSDLPTLVVKAGETTSKLDIICDQAHSKLEAGDEFAFSYKFSAPNAEQKPAYKFSFAKSDNINRKGLDKKLAGEIEKFFNERMANLDAEIAEREEAERQRAEQERIEAEQRAEQERIEAEQRAEQERIEAEQRAAEAQAEREQRAAEAEERRRQRGCLITETGNCYHTDYGCPSLSRSHNLQEMTVGEAEDMGLSPCGRCR
ncbi:MAG: hypothetical protein IKG21_13700 [Atopobiaceae bacterium]|nr:hypothetical protein [Atopobiaceae bacterium]